MRKTAAVLTILFLAACGSGRPISTSGGVAAVGVVLVAPVFFGSGTSAPANLEVLVENRSGQPITVRNVRLQSSGMVQWGVYPVQRAFNETIAPGVAKAFPMFATAVARTSRLTPNEPLNVRTVVEFEQGEKRYQELYIGRAIEP